jgi:hypothetical protein
MWNRNGFAASSAALPPTTANPALGARPSPTFSTIEAAHTDLIERLAVLKPYRILYIADAQDLMERAQRLQQVLN